MSTNKLNICVYIYFFVYTGQLTGKTGLFLQRTKEYLYTRYRGKDVAVIGQRLVRGKQHETDMKVEHRRRPINGKTKKMSKEFRSTRVTKVLNKQTHMPRYLSINQFSSNQESNVYVSIQARNK